MDQHDDPTQHHPDTPWTLTRARPHALYRFYDAADHLLYVGITMDLPGRWGNHRDSKPWWTEIARSTIEHHPDRAAAIEAERTAIQVEKPLHNVQHNGPARASARPPASRKICWHGWVEPDGHGGLECCDCGQNMETLLRFVDGHAT